MERALSTMETALGPDDPYVIAILVNFAELLRQDGRDSEAASMSARAATITGTQEQ